LRQITEAAWEHRTSPEQMPADAAKAAGAVLDALTAGILRVAEPSPDGTWLVNEWVKKAILLYFRLTPGTSMDAGILRFHDKVPVQGDWMAKGVRVVPPAVVRHGAHVCRGAVLMPCYVNVGAWVGEDTMVDTWATIGSCAQVGARCHISGGVGIGGVLEPPQATPVIIGDDCFIGARSEVAEGVRVGDGAVLAMGCCVGASTRIYNAMTQEITLGEIPPRAVVVPGSLPSSDGTHGTYALIIKKWRDAKTDARTALNEILRG
jgi:2,3,4,5-tetrahydropyridine-2-carboxylate N-succinyltransferase